MATRYRILPPEGDVLVSTDVHGCGDDFRRMREIFNESTDETHWVILGDIVHGPDDGARARRPDLYGYADESAQIAAEILELRAEYPERVHFVLGNHDWAHVGGPKVGKFYQDEAGHLEETLSRREKLPLWELFESALLCAMAPCGAFMSHASPGAPPETLEELDAIELDGSRLSEREEGLVRHFTNYYGQREAVSRSFLDQMSELSGLELRFVIHGHDRDEEGWFVQENTQICPVIFGAPREKKRYLRLDLGAVYDSVHDLEVGEEILRLFDDE